MAQLVDTFAPLRREVDKFTQMNLDRPVRERTAKLQDLQIQGAEQKLSQQSSMQDLQGRQAQAKYDLTNLQIDSQRAKLDEIQATQTDQKDFSDFSRNFDGSNAKSAVAFMKQNPTSKVAAGIIGEEFKRAKGIFDIDPVAGAKHMSDVLGFEIKAKKKSDGIVELKANGVAVGLDPANGYKEVYRVKISDPKKTKQSKSSLGKLTDEMNALPDGDPMRDVYQKAIDKAVASPASTTKEEFTPLSAKKEIGKVRSEIAKLASTGGIDLQTLMAADKSGDGADKLLSLAKVSPETKAAITANLAYIRDLEKKAYPEKANTARAKSLYFEYRKTMSAEQARSAVTKDLSK